MTEDNVIARMALAISARNNGRHMITPGRNADELAEAAAIELAAAWEEEFGYDHIGARLLREALLGKQP